MNKVYLKMAWLDFRLAHNYSAPLLLRTNEYLEQIWKPGASPKLGPNGAQTRTQWRPNSYNSLSDPYFANTKDSDWHEVTTPNVLMRIYEKGEVYYEQRLMLNPSCNLVLCKYPHDLQRCGLQMASCECNLR